MNGVVNVSGYLSSGSGVGVATRGYLASIRHLGWRTSKLDFSPTTGARMESASPIEDEVAPLAATADVTNLVCVNANQLGLFLAQAGRRLLRHNRNLAVWAWELPEFPARWFGACALFDEIWVATEFERQAVQAISPVPVVTVPLLVTARRGSRIGRAHFGFAPDEFVFLFMFDFLSVFARKNPLDLIEAYQMAFAADPSVRLVIKCMNADWDPENFARLQQAADGVGATILSGYFDVEEKDGLLASADAYVSLHRSEGFGYTLAESMLMGKPVIATGWSGNMDFMTRRNSYPVDFELVSITEGVGPYERGQRWAQPDLAHAARLMRQVYEERDAATAKGELAAQEIGARYGLHAVAAKVEERFAAMAQQRRPRRALRQRLAAEWFWLTSILRWTLVRSYRALPVGPRNWARAGLRRLGFSSFGRAKDGRP